MGITQERDAINKKKEQEETKKEQSRKRNSSSLPRGISPEANQNELRHKYRQQQDALKQHQDTLKANKQKQASELQRENIKRQTQLREKFEEQEWLKKNASNEALREKGRSLSAQRLPR